MLKTLQKRGPSPLVTVLLLALLLSAVYSFWNPTGEKGPTEVPLSSFVEDVGGGQVQSIKVRDTRLDYVLQDDTKKYTYKEYGQTLPELLEDVDKGLVEAIEIQIVDTSDKGVWINILLAVVPFILIIGFLYFMMRGAASSNNQALSFGKSSARLHDKEKERTTFDDVAGVKEAKEELEEIVDFLKNPSKYTAMGAKIPKGVMLVGGPGTGKTLLARAVAGEANVPFFNISGSEFVEMFVGVGASVTGDTPVLVRDQEGIGLRPISEVVDRYYPENQEGFPIFIQNLKTLGFEPEASGFRGIKEGNGRHFFGASAWQNVKAVFRHKVSRIYEIHYRGGAIKTTGEHSIFIRRRNMITAIRADELKPGDILVNLPFKVRSTFSPQTGTQHKIKAHRFTKALQPVFLSVFENSELEEEEHIYANVLASQGLVPQREVAETYQISQTAVSAWLRGRYLPRLMAQRRDHAYLPEKVEISPMLCKLFGYYTAEGRATGRLEFTFGIHECPYHQEVLKGMKEIFELEAKIEAREADHSLRILYPCAPLGKFFANHCGDGSHHKHIPAFLWEMPKEYFLAYLEGYANGDGYTTKDGKLSCTSVSKQLILELAWLASMHGIQTGIRKTKSPGGRIIKTKPLPETTSWNLIIGKSSHPFKKTTRFPNQFKKPIITKIEVREHNDYVYDLCGCDQEAFFGGEKPILLHNSRVRDLFKKAKRNAPCIVFMDEIDAVGRQRGAGLGGGHDEREQTLNQILTEMDGFETNTNIIVMAATNRPDVLDPALLRPGRFDRRVVVDSPSIDDRAAILKVHSKNKPLAKNADLSQIAKQTPGFSGADLENLMNEAAILAAKKNQKEITLPDLEVSVEKVQLGPERKSHVLTPEEKERTAIHETGHAIVGYLLPDCDPLKKITIISRGLSLGSTLFVPEEDKHLYTQQKFEHEMASLLGGYVAEEMIYGQVSTGPSNDLERATQMSRRMVTEFGMSSRIGPTVFGDKNHEVFLGRDFGHVKNYSEEKAAQIDSAVESFVERAHKLAKDLLTKHKKALKRIAKALIEKETLTREEFIELFEKVMARTVPKKLKLKAIQARLLP